MNRLQAVFTIACLLLLYYPCLMVITLIDTILGYNPYLTSSFLYVLVTIWNDNSVYVGSYWAYVKDKWNE